MSAITLRSSVKNRKRAAWKILDDNELGGRGRILVIQLQGHLFFGNVAQLNESVNGLLLGSDNRTTTTDQQHDSIGKVRPGQPVLMQQHRQKPWILIMDFSLVLGIDTSATQAIVKLKDVIAKTSDVTLCIFVTGSNDGFPCEINLSQELSNHNTTTAQISNNSRDYGTSEGVNEETALLVPTQNLQNYDRKPTASQNYENYEGSHVFVSMDEALAFAENALIARENPALLNNHNSIHLSMSSTSFFPLLEPSSPLNDEHSNINNPNNSINHNNESTIERATALRYLENMCPPNSSKNDIESLFSFFRREVYHENEFIWRQGSEGDCAKLLVKGILIALLENEAGTRETISTGNMIGELGLVMENKNIPRMSSVICATGESVVYSLSRKDWEELIVTNPRVARFVDYICISYLANRVQHVSNRIFETRCLPI